MQYLYRHWQFVSTRTLDHNGSPNGPSQLNWIWQSDMRVNRAGPWTWTGNSIHNKLRSVWQQKIQYRGDLQQLWQCFWLWGWQDMVGRDTFTLFSHFLFQTHWWCRKTNQYFCLFFIQFMASLKEVCFTFKTQLSLLRSVTKTNFFTSYW